MQIFVKLQRQLCSLRLPSRQANSTCAVACSVYGCNKENSHAARASLQQIKNLLTPLARVAFGRPGPTSTLGGFTFWKTGSNLQGSGRLQQQRLGADSHETAQLSLLGFALLLFFFFFFFFCLCLLLDSFGIMTMTQRFDTVVIIALAGIL